ncbi:MAG: hypothetical protein ACE3JP_16120, partial [Ectobacillus sp.]
MFPARLFFCSADKRKQAPADFSKPNFENQRSQIMKRAYKTSKKKRTNYIYYTAEGTKIVITPG